jgi:predicted dehydrogenase
MAWPGISKAVERRGRMLKVAIVGCGKIADDHASQIRRIKGCEIVGVCDREPLMAKQLSERFQVKGFFSSLGALFDQCRPDVVHITTPPKSHFEVAKQCLLQGCHVYVEKPFTVDLQEAEELIRLAEEKNLRMTVGHDDQFRHAARRMRDLVRSGYLGGAPVHMESHYCYEIGEGYASALLGDRRHWVRALPGGLLQNVISHGIARIAEFFTAEAPQVIAHGFVSPFLKRLGENEIVDELRVILCDENSATAYFTFSSQMRPSLHQFRLYGPANGVILDQDNETLILLRGGRYKSFLEQFVPPATFAKQYAGNLAWNVRAFLAADFHSKSGMKHLIESFYKSIQDNLPVPIPYHEILRTSAIMDAIFSQLSSLPERELPSMAGS